MNEIRLPVVHLEEKDEKEGEGGWELEVCRLNFNYY